MCSDLEDFSISSAANLLEDLKFSLGIPSLDDRQEVRGR